MDRFVISDIHCLCWCQQLIQTIAVPVREESAIFSIRMI